MSIGFWFKRKVNIVRFWLITKLVGKMPIAANIRISDYDSEKNFRNKLLDYRPHMFYNNVIYDLQSIIQQEVFTGNNGKVTRQGNVFVLNR